MSSSYNMWPIILIIYNLPLWKCMKEKIFIISLLILRSKSPRKEIDVYLQPFIKEPSERIVE